MRLATASETEEKRKTATQKSTTTTKEPRSSVALGGQSILHAEEDSLEMGQATLELTNSRRRVCPQQTK
jgi:hypothetical protein